MTEALVATEARLEFEIRRLGIPTLRGRFDQIEVTVMPDPTVPDGWVFDLLITVTSIKTGSDSRDARLAGEKYLQAMNYPEITFHSRRIEPLHDLENSLSRVTGELTIRGISREVDWESELLARAEDEMGELGAGYVGRLKIDPRDWGLKSKFPLLPTTVELSIRVSVRRDNRGNERQQPSAS